MLSRHSGPGWMPTGFLIYIPIYLLFYFWFLKKKKQQDKILWTLLFIIICFLFDVTQFPWPIGQEAKDHVRFKHDFSINLEPLQNMYWNLFRSFRLRNLVENIGNILVFMPFGFILGAIKRHDSWSILKVSFWSFAFSLSIELMQLATSYYGLNVRIFDVDDLIMNTVGGLLGCLCFLVLRFIWQKIRVKRHKTI